MHWKFSPEEVEAKLLSFENKVANMLKEKALSAKFLLLLILSCLFFLPTATLFNFQFPFLYSFKFLFSFKTILVIAILSFGTFFIKNQGLKVVWGSMVFFLCGFYDLVASHWFQKSADYRSFLFLILQGVLGWGAWRLRKKFKKPFLITVYILSSLLLYVVGYYSSTSIGWFYFHQPVLFSAFIVAVLAEEVEVSFVRKFQLLFNPAHLFLSVNYPIDSYLSGDNQLTWEMGAIHFIKAITALFVTSFLYHQLPAKGLHLSTLKDYMMYLSLVVAVGNTVTGISKMYGIDVPACSNFAFLSRSPLDFMKRENAHAYSFSLRFFYFNFLKYTKKPVIIVLGYFLVFPFYRNILMYFASGDLVSLNGFMSFLLTGYLFWSLLLAAIILFPEKFLRKHVGNEWWHIFFNHITMYLIFFFRGLIIKG